MRLNKLLIIVLALISTIFLSSVNAEPLGTTGKIKGKVVDSKTNTPLIGAVVKIEGTQMGASTDEVGEYVIVNVNVGTYSIKCSYVGYEAQIQTEVKVSADITTTVDFSLGEVVIKTDTVEIIAKRNTVPVDQSGKIITQESIENTGIRGIENIAAKTAGVVQDERGTSINIRGGRTNETAVIIDGVLTTNPLDGNSTAYVSNSLLQELAVLTGGFSAEYGNVLSGVINVTTKTGSTKYTGSVELISDDIYKTFLGTNTQGYNVYSLSLGGPLIPTKELKSFLTFYGGIEKDFWRVSSPSWISSDLGFTNGVLPDYSTDRWSGNGKLSFDFSVLNKKSQMKLIAGVNVSRTYDRTWVQSYMLNNSLHNPENETKNDQAYFKFSHTVTPKIFYEVQFNWFRTQSKSYDPYLKENIYWYGDPVYTGAPAVGSRVPLDAYSLFALYGRVVNALNKDYTDYYEGSFNVTGQFKKNEIKLGGNFKYHTIRSWAVSPVGLTKYRDSSEAVKKAAFEGAIGLANYWGYSYDGSTVDNSKAVDGDPNSFNGAKHPIVAAFYLQDKVEFKDFNINAGIRLDYLNANTWRIKDITNVVRFGDPSQLDVADFDAKSEATYAVSPRLGFSFPVTEKSIFHAQYGRFVQLPQLQYLYNGYSNMSYWINSAGFSGSFGNPNLKPEKTTSYEIGIKQQIGDKLSIDLTAFYKETEDLIGIKKYPQLPNQIQVYENQDYGTIRGFDFAIDLRRTNGLALSIAYSLAFASGTGSDPNSAGTAAWLGTEQPKFTYPLDYDQRHTGTVNLDYRFGKTDVPKGVWGDILSRLGINLLYNFNSGRPYSKKSPESDPFASTGSGAVLQSTINGASGPWNQRLDLKIDKTVTVWKFDVNFYVWCINVLNTKTVQTVWDGSGDPDNTGYLSTNQGMNTANSYEGKVVTDPSDPTKTVTLSKDEYVKEYNLRSMDISHYGAPRQLRLGFKLNF
jgi:outer membrane receptor protein involved in Fe transport